MTIPKPILALQSKAQEQLDQKNFDGAIKTQLAALKIAQELNEPKLTAILYRKLGQILEQQGGNLQKSLYAYESALKALNEEDHQLERTIISLRKVSKSYRPEKAIQIPDVFSPAVASSIEEALKDKSLAIKLLLHIGNGYFHQPQLDPALNAFQQVLTQAGIAEQPTLKAQTLIKIGEIFRQQKKTPAASEKVNEAFGLLEQHGSESDKRHAYALQARLHFQDQKTELAIPIYQKAITLFEEISDFNNAGKIYAQLGQLYLGQGHFTLAKKAYANSLDCASKSSAGKLEWHVHWGLGTCYAKEKQWRKAADYLEESRKYILKRQNELYTDEGKVAFLESVQDVFNQLINAYVNIGDDAAIQKALEVAEDAKGQSLDDLMEGRKRNRVNQYKPNKTTTDPGFNPVQQMSSGISALPVDFDTSAEENPNTLLGTTESAEGMDMMRQFAPSISFANNPPDLLSGFISSSAEPVPILEKRVIANRCFLFFYKLDNRLLMWLKKADGTLRFHTANLDGKRLSEKVNKLRVSLMEDAKSRGINVSRSAPISTEEEALRGFTLTQIEEEGTDFQTLSRELYEALLFPFQKELKEDVETLVIVPHDFLWLLPFAALKDKNDKYFGVQYRLLYAPSIKALSQIDDSNPYSNIEEAEALIIGNPTMSKAHQNYQFENLEGAEREATELAKLFKVNALIKDAASLKAIEVAAKTKHVFHLATHGIVDEKNPLDSFVVLADTYKEDGTLDEGGLLKARDIMNWSLPCELVNLSACQTALGQRSGEGVIGLSRSFLVAGSRTVLVSLWNISDAATAEFMIAFYKKYLAQGNKAVALQSAIKTLQAHPEYEHPVFWSAFTLVGSDD